jgi:cobaltochelatase CobS
VNCTCNVPSDVSLAEVTKESLDKLTPPRIRQLANAHNLGPDGIVGPGQSVWRACASKTDLITSILAHKHGTPVPQSTIPEPPTVKKSAPKITDAPSLDEGVRMISEHVAIDVMNKLLPNLMANHQPPIDLVEVRNIIDEEVNKIRGSFLEIKIKQPDNTVINVGRQHSRFPDLVEALDTGLHILLVGPAGSGKTEAALAAARAKKLEVEVISVGPQTTQSELAGYRDANGNYRNTALRRAFEPPGKLLVIDEMDAGNGGVFTFVNACLSNNIAGFPDGPVERGEKFQVIGCANTFGTGADMMYVGRAQLDGATLDRFVPMVWDYDEGFELDLALAHNPDSRPWVETVWKYRRNMIAAKVRHIISPRASIFGAKLMKKGFKQTALEKMLIFKGLNKEVITKIKGVDKL